jgi:hypothetical protein
MDLPEWGHNFGQSGVPIIYVLRRKLGQDINEYAGLSNFGVAEQYQGHGIDLDGSTVRKQAVKQTS